MNLDIMTVDAQTRTKEKHMQRTGKFAAVVAALLFLLPTLGIAQGGITLEQVHGLWLLNGSEYVLCTGSNIIYKLRLTNNSGHSITGLTLGFRIYSPDGAEWGIVHAQWARDPALWFDLFNGVNMFGADGVGADTVAFYGSRMSGPGIPAGFDSVLFIIAAGPISNSQANRTLCLDSSWFPPGGSWLWSPTYVPSWDGPHCYRLMPCPCGDDDSDGVYTGCDNCPDIYNPNQKDSDWDGVGDACDPDCCQVMGDANHDGIGPGIDDLIYVVDYMFAGGPPAPCFQEVDIDGDGQGPNIADLVWLVAYMFGAGGPPVPCP